MVAYCVVGLLMHPGESSVKQQGMPSLPGLIEVHHMDVWHERTRFCIL